MSRKKPDPKIETRLCCSDMDLFNRMVATAETSKADLARETIRWYMHHYEALKDRQREHETAQAMRYFTDQTIKYELNTANRICGMLARLGAEVGTIYELMWRACANDDARDQFRDAANSAKQRQRKRLDNDERTIAERLRNVVTAPSLKNEKSA